MQTDQDGWPVGYNTYRPHQGLEVDGRTPYQALQDGLTIEIEGQEVTAGPEEAA